MDQGGLSLAFALQFEHLVLQSRIIRDFAQDASSALAKNDTDFANKAISNLKECTEQYLSVLSELRDIIRATLTPKLIAEYDREAAKINGPYELHEKFFDAAQKYGIGSA